MAKSLKINGIQEIRAVKSRATRQRALGRITETDCDYIVSRCNEIEAKIVEMHEDSPDITKEIFG